MSTNQHVTALYCEHHGWLQSVLRRRSGCSQLAADIAQDTYLRLLVRNQDCSLIQEPRAYLARIARGLLANHWRRRDIEQAFLDGLTDQPEAVAGSPETHALIIETLCLIDALLEALPVKVRQAFLMARLDGLRYGEIAARLGVSERMVKKYMVQAMLHCLQHESAWPE